MMIHDFEVFEDTLYTHYTFTLYMNEMPHYVYMPGNYHSSGK